MGLPWFHFDDGPDRMNDFGFAPKHILIANRICSSILAGKLYPGKRLKPDTKLVRIAIEMLFSETTETDVIVEPEIVERESVINLLEKKKG